MQGHNLALDDHLHSSVLKMETESWKAEAAYYAGTMCTFAAHRKVVGCHITGFKFYYGFGFRQWPRELWRLGSIEMQ